MVRTVVHHYNVFANLSSHGGIIISCCELSLSKRVKAEAEGAE